MTYENEYYEMNDKNSSNVSHLKTLYTDTTKHVYTEENNKVLTCDQLFANHYRQDIHPSSVPVIVKDVTRPYTYYTMKSYGQAQDNNYYVNFDDHVNGPAAAIPSHHYNNYRNGNNNTNRSETMFENECGTKVPVHDDSCAKIYLCSLLGCFACCLFQLKPI